MGDSDERGTVREPDSMHEAATYLALGLKCGHSSSNVRVRFSTEFEDKHRGTDMVLVHPRRKPLWIDATKYRRGVSGKITRNKDFRKDNPRSRWNWILRVPLDGPGTDVMVDPCFQQAWDRLKSSRPVSFLPEDICLEHGKRCPLIPKLEDLGRFLIYGQEFPQDWRALFE